MPTKKQPKKKVSALIKTDTKPSKKSGTPSKKKGKK